MSFVVRAEGHDGREVTLCEGFASVEDAEDHPVKLSDWKRVWIERVGEDELAAPSRPSGSRLQRARFDVEHADREELECRIEQIDDALRDNTWIPSPWRLTATEAAFLNALSMRKLASKEQLHALIYGGAADGGPEIKLVDVMICKLRRKLTQWGVRIKTRWGQGYELDPGSMKLIERLKDGQSFPSLLEGSALSTSFSRPILPIGLPANLRPNVIVRERPDVRMTSPLDLRIEPSYQRDLSGKSVRLIRRIVANWDWAKFKPPICAETEDGLFIIDGQHTAIAAATHPDIVAIPIMVVASDNIEARAAAFVAQNRDRVAMSAHQIFHAQVAAGVARCRAIQTIADKAGATIPRHMPQRGRAKIGEIAALNEIDKIFGGSGPEVLYRVLCVAVLSGQSPLQQRPARALASLFTEERFSAAARLPDHVIADALQTISDLDGSAKTRATMLGTTWAKAAADLISDACDLGAEREAA